MSLYCMFLFPAIIVLNTVVQNNAYWVQGKMENENVAISKMCSIIIASAALRIWCDRRQPRRWAHAWIYMYIYRRRQLGAHHALMKELASEAPHSFTNFIRMDKQDFDELLNESNSIFSDTGIQTCVNLSLQQRDCLWHLDSILLYLQAFLLFQLTWAEGSQGELIVYQWSIVRPSVVVIHTFKLEYLWSHLANLDQILYVASLGWGKGCIRFWGRLDQNSGFHGNRKLPLAYNGENDVSTFSRLFLIRFFLYLQVTRTCIKSQTSSNFGQIGPLTTKLAALELLKFFP